MRRKERDTVNRFPAIFLGGPPHSGKSTLLYRLSHALVARGIQHYALRASPDGEGNWAYESPKALVRELRLRTKSDWTPKLAAQIARDIDARHLPLLVDGGGKVSPENEMIAAACSHAVLLAADLATLAPWRALLARLGRPLVAEFQSNLDGSQQVERRNGVVYGTVSGLAAGISSDGVGFTTLVDLLSNLLDYPTVQIYHIHRNLTSTQIFIDVTQPVGLLPAHSPEQPWYPHELPTLLAALPRDATLAIYGRGPVWLYAALAAHMQPDVQVFDAQRGWLTPPVMAFAALPDSTRLSWHIHEHAGANWLKIDISGGYLDYNEAVELPIPYLPIERGVIFDGRMPVWLGAALARAYRMHPWLAVYQPTTDRAVVITGTGVGEVIKESM